MAPPKSAFVRSRAVHALNVAGMAGALGACATLAAMTAELTPAWSHVQAEGLPCFVFGLAWALVLRWETPAPQVGAAWRWLAAVPLASLAAALAYDLEVPFRDPMALELAVLGAGNVRFWGPPLINAMIVFGVPAAFARRWSETGLDGAERGERLMGYVSGSLGVAATLLVLWLRGTANWGAVDARGAAWLAVFGVAAAGGGVAAALAHQRLELRRRFAERVRTGAEPDYRFETTAEGTALVRFADPAAYRAGEAREVILETFTRAAERSAALRAGAKPTLFPVVVFGTLLVLLVLVVMILVDRPSLRCPNGYVRVDGRCQPTTLY